MMLMPYLQQQKAPQSTDPRTRLLQTMAKLNAKYASLGALPKYGESQHADRFQAGAQPEGGAFQETGFQDNGYQVF